MKHCQLSFILRFFSSPRTYLVFVYVLTFFIVEQKMFAHSTQHIWSELPRELILKINARVFARYVYARIENNITLNFSQLVLCLEREVFSSHVKNGLKLFPTLFP